MEGICFKERRYALFYLISQAVNVVREVNRNDALDILWRIVLHGGGFGLGLGVLLIRAVFHWNEDVRIVIGFL